MIKARSSSSFASEIRCLSLKMVHAARASHIGSALSISDLVAVLYSNTLRVDPKFPHWEARDRFILSKGHACVSVYAALALRGFFPRELLDTYGCDFSPLMNHISHRVPGVEFSSGSLGHGLPFGAGKAYSAKLMGQLWRTFVLLSDGELAEGSNWEAMLFASHHKLSNLVAIVDYNKLQSLTTVEKTLSIEPLAEKIQAFGWSVREVDGHDHESIYSELSTTPWNPDKPNMLIAHTTKGKGVSFMENSVDWHYKSPTSEQLTLALAEIKNA